MLGPHSKDSCGVDIGCPLFMEATDCNTVILILRSEKEGSLVLGKTPWTPENVHPKKTHQS